MRSHRDAIALVFAVVACGRPGVEPEQIPKRAAAPESKTVAAPAEDDRTAAPAPAATPAHSPPPGPAFRLVARPDPYFFVDGCMASAAASETEALRECRRLASDGEPYQRRRCKCRRDLLIAVSPDDPIAFYRGCCWAAAESAAAARVECQRRVDEQWCEPDDVEAVHVATGPYVRKAKFRPFEGSAHRFLVPSDGHYPDWVTEDGEPPCFPAGTAVELVGGPTPIERVRVGDRVVTWVDGHRDTAPVLDVRMRSAESLLHLRLRARTLRVTPEHPIWSDGAWRVAAALRVGDRVRGLDGELEILGIDVVEGDVEVFSLRVGTPHSYFAGGVWVHNY